MPDFNFKLVNKGGEWVPIMYAGVPPYITVGFTAPKNWVAVDFKVFRVFPVHNIPGTGSPVTAEDVHDGIMAAHIAPPLPRNRTVPQAYSNWKNGVYTGAGSNRYTFLKHHVDGNHFVIRDRRNRGPGPAEFEFIIHFTDDSGYDVLVDPGIRNEY